MSPLTVSSEFADGHESAASEESYALLCRQGGGSPRGRYVHLYKNLPT